MGFLSSVGKALGGGDAIGALVGGVVNTIGSSILANSANAKAKRAANAQRAYETEMSNTAHRRQVEDLKAAGLNPILSAHSQGASTPNSAIAAADHIGEMQIGQGINSAIQYSIERQNANANTTTAESTKSLNTAQEYKAYADANAITKSTEQNVKESNSRIMNMKAERDVMHAQLNKIATETTIMKGDNIKAYLKGNGIEWSEKKIKELEEIARKKWKEEQKKPYKETKTVEEFYNEIFSDAL